MILFDWLRVSSDLGIFAVRRTYDVPITHPRKFFYYGAVCNTPLSC